MKFIKFSVVICLTIVQSSLFSQNLKLASDVWPPFTNIKGEKALAIEMVQTALERIEAINTLEITEFENIIGGIKSGKYSGSYALWRTEMREEFINYSNPYLQNQLILVGLKGANVEVNELSELGEAKIGLVKGYAYGDRIMKGNNINFINAESDQKNLEKLFNKEIDYMLVDNILIFYLLKHQTNDVEEFLAIAADPIDTKNLYFGLGKDVQNSEELINKFNAEIKKMILEGLYHEILGVNWIEADINGDGIKELVLAGKEAGENAPDQKFIYEIFEDNQDQEKPKYYINGTYYDNWESVPDSLKKAPVIAPLKDLNPGLQIKF